MPIEKDNPITRANDSRVAPGNSIWFGTMGRKLETDAGAIYHVKDGRCTPLFSPGIHPQRNLLFARWPHRLLL